MLYSTVAVSGGGIFLTGTLIVLGFNFPVTHLRFWLLFLPVTLTASGGVILYCNAAVLRTLRRKIRSNSSVSYYSNENDGGSTAELPTNETNLDSCNEDLDDENVPLVGNPRKFFAMQI